MSAVAELDAALQGMLALKPPGVSGSKISTITALCTANVQSESVLVQKIYTHFKKTPGSHKLGVLYVVDSVTRQWVDHARKAGQPLGATAGDGTYAAGINRVTELLPVLMTDIIQHAPEDQKEKIRKLVDIWERGSTFPAAMLQSFKEKLNAPSNMRSTTPPGSPPRDLQRPAPSAPAPNTSEILKALANMAKQSAAATPPPPPPPPQNANNGLPAQDLTHITPSTQIVGSHAIPAPVVTQGPMFPPTSQAMNPSLAGLNMASPFAAFNLNGLGAPSTSQAPSTPMPAYPAMPAPQANSAGGEALQQQLMLIQFLMQQGIPQEQWAPIIAALNAGSANISNPNLAGGVGGVGAGVMAGWPLQAGAPNLWNQGRNDAPSRDRHDAGDSHMRSPTGRYHRDRSRSPPAWGRDRDASPPRRRDSPIYGEYDGGRGDPYDRRGKGRGGRGREHDYRQRSPPGGRRARSPGTPDRYALPPGGGPKWVDHDSTIGPDSIKVLSRTLFVGGVTITEDDLRSIFSRFGTVQTCIVNSEKRHAFVKMISRADALAAKEGMETQKPTDLQLRTRWGVGFGPRDCSDYQTGISVIPIGRLTDADRKWMLTAEYGGSGGKAIEGGMVVEEPDIEIGAGVSSKAISRRMVTDQGGKSGPRSTRGAQESSSRYRRPERADGPDRDSVNAIGVPPPVPGFGFQFPTLPNGMPMFPPGFMLPGALSQQQPPPPGQT